MAKTVKFAASGDKQLKKLQEQLGELKNDLAGLIQEYEDAGADDDKLDTLTEVLDALEDAWDGMLDILDAE